MPVTKMADVINPSVFTPYVINRTMELSAIFSSGIVSNNPEFDSLASETGPLVNMPFWNDLTGESEAMTESDITPDNISSGADAAAIIRRVKSWGATGLSGALAGSDPMKAIGDLVSQFWARDMQKELIAILNGSLSATASNVHDVSAAGSGSKSFDKSNFIDAQAKLGDAAELLTAVVMHSATYTHLKKAEQINILRPSENSSFEVYDGKRVIVDDGCPASAGTYTTYLFGVGAVALGNGNPPTIVPTEVVRRGLTGSGEDVLVNRRTFILHPRGIKYNKAPDALSGPTRVELGNKANWTPVYDAKQIRIVAFKHKLE